MAFHYYKQNIYEQLLQDITISKIACALCQDVHV